MPRQLGVCSHRRARVLRHRRAGRTIVRHTPRLDEQVASGRASTRSPRRASNPISFREHARPGAGGKSCRGCRARHERHVVDGGLTPSVESGDVRNRVATAPHVVKGNRPRLEQITPRFLVDWRSRCAPSMGRARVDARCRAAHSSAMAVFSRGLRSPFGAPPENSAIRRVGRRRILGEHGRLR